MKKLIFFIFSLIFISCTDNYTENLNKMAELSKKQLEDAVFKDNGTITFLEFTPIAYQVISESSFDSVSLSNLKTFYLFYEYRYNDLNQEIANASLKINDNTMLPNDYYRNKAIELNNEMEELDKSYQSLKELDSLLTDNIANNKNSNELYEFSFIIKATLTEYKEGAYPENILDTLTQYFHKDFSIKTHPEFENIIKHFKELNEY